MIKKFCTAAISCLITFMLVGSCDQQSSNNKKGADGYHFMQKQYSNEYVTVKIIVHKTKDEMRAAIREHTKDPDTDSDKLAAFSLLFKGHPELCEIHMIDPSIRYEPEFVGHEFLHCVYGQWHKDNMTH